MKLPRQLRQDLKQAVGIATSATKPIYQKAAADWLRTLADQIQEAASQPSASHQQP